MATTDTDITDQIAHLDAMIVAYRTATLAFVTNGAQKKYRFDTGQQIIDVERQDPKEMNAAIESFMNQKQILCQRIGLAKGTLNVRSV